MRERPIIFSGEMVKAILDGRKTQTRRVVKLTGDGIGSIDRCTIATTGPNGSVITCPYGVPGDKLWVRETWQKYGDGVAYRASAPFEDNRNWKPSIHMPRWASRITLEITGVRAERLQDISEEDVLAEGQPDFASSPELSRFMAMGAKAWYIHLWDKINGKKHPWSSNPFVWVIECRRISDE